MREFFHKYDPGFFSLIYSLKATCALIVSVLISYYFLNAQVAIWSVTTCSGVFFLNNINGFRKDRFIFICIYALTCILGLFLVWWFINLGVYFSILVFIWLFFALSIAKVSQNLSKVLMTQSLSILIAVVAAEAMNSPLITMLEGYIIGGVVGIAFRTLSFKKYGVYTRGEFRVLLNEMSLAVNALFDDKFNFWLQKSFDKITEIKLVMSFKSANYSDPILVKHQERVLFYLYKCDEILHSLNSLSMFFKENRGNAELKAIQHEISHNINELQNIFSQKEINLRESVYKSVKDDYKFAMISAGLDILYHNVFLMVKGGFVPLKVAKSGFKLREYLSLFDIKNPYFQFCFKFAFAAAGAVFVGRFFEVDHGVWLALGVMGVMKANSTITGIALKQGIIGSILGVAVTALLVFILRGSELYYTLIFVAIFLVFYTKVFGYLVWSASLMGSLCVMFGLISDNFFHLLMVRFSDMFVGFVIAVLVSVMIWRKSSKDEIIPNILNLLDKFGLYFEINSDHSELREQILAGINALKESLISSKSKDF
ncbi:MAG: FUSC family protein, partial [Campylobacter lanienae]|uniref:FUSC family protein n=1 Tax=Campylobacter lanienae TaxID=75658 RepID=UPI00242C1F19